MSDSDHVRNRLLKEYKADEFGTWRILGEDPNCDWGGHHHEPELETVTGTYQNVIEYAMTLKNFFTWGYGGRIIKQAGKHKNIDNVINNRIPLLKEEKDKLLARIKEIDSELNTLKVKKEKL